MIPKDLPELVQSAYEVSNEGGMSKEELEIQHKHKEWISIQISALSLAEKKGQQKGELQKANKGAINLLKMNILSDEQIAQAMDLTIEQVSQLRQLPTDD
jgi:predicted transposase/invertase (TIGR01784 family)